MPKVKLLTVTCENRPGTLSYVARVLGDAKVNILAFHCGTIGQNGFVHVVVDNVRKGKKALRATGLSYTEADVLLEELPNVAGALGYFTGRLRSEEHTSELQSLTNLVCRLLLEKKKKKINE